MRMSESISNRKTRRTIRIISFEVKRRSSVLNNVNPFYSLVESTFLCACIQVGPSIKSLPDPPS